jgi:hypothetical protein
MHEQLECVLCCGAMQRATGSSTRVKQGSNASMHACNGRRAHQAAKQYNANKEAAARLSKYSHCVIGPNLPEIALTTSWPTMPPNIAHIGLISPEQVEANLASTASSSSACTALSCEKQLT